MNRGWDLLLIVLFATVVGGLAMPLLGAYLTSSVLLLFILTLCIIVAVFTAMVLLVDHFRL